MSTANVVNREPVELPVLAGLDGKLWSVLLELAEARVHGWTLIGGQMVLMHALEHRVLPPRVSTDLDILVNARVVTGAVRRFVLDLEERGFESAGTSPEGVAHRYTRAGISIDVLAPEGLGDRADLTTTPPGRTLQTPGGTQALQRTEMVPVTFRGRTGLVPRPSLLGAIICKAEAVGVDDVPHSQRTDLALLLSLVDDPLNMAELLGPTDRRRLRRRSEMDDPTHPAWHALDQDAASRGLAAYRLLVRHPYSLTEAKS